MSNSLRALVAQGACHDTLCQQALEDGMITLHEDGADKVRQGIISVQELARVLI